VRSVKKVWATIASTALTATILAGGAAPSMAAEDLTASDRAAASTLDLSTTEYREVKSLGEEGKLELWAGGKKFSPKRSTNLPVGIAAAYQPKTWGACGVRTDNYKHVRTWRVTTAPWQAKDIVMKCGTWTSKNPNGGWGYRHVKGKHGGEWAALGNQVQANWRDIADFAITDALDNIYSGSERASNNTFTYKGEVQLRKYNGSVIRTYYTRVTADQTDRRLITAFYSSSR